MLAALLLTVAAITWETKLDRATAAARQSNQPILIEFWAVSCEPCREMDRDVYTDERVQTAIRNVKAVRIDIDREPGLARKYEISGAPTLLVTDLFGRELFRYAGALPADRMLRLLEAVPRDIRRINELSEALARRKSDFALLSELGHELRAAGFYRSSSAYLEKALKTKEGRQRGDARAAVLIAMERNAFELRLYADAIRLCEQAIEELAGETGAAARAEALRQDLARARRAQAGG